MGTHICYVGDIWRRKSSYVMWLLSRMRCWSYRQGNSIVTLSITSRFRCARKMGFRFKRGYNVVRVRVRRGNCIFRCRRGIVHGKIVGHGVKNLKLRRNLRYMGEMRVQQFVSNGGVVNSYWVNSDATHKYFEVITVDFCNFGIRRDYRINWVCNGYSGSLRSRGLTIAGKCSVGRKGRGGLYVKNRASMSKVWRCRNF